METGILIRAGMITYSGSPRVNDIEKQVMAFGPWNTVAVLRVF
jgi:hypothetical protein